jgi:hypothetical protein
MTSGPVVPMVWEGNGVVAAGRVILGATKPSESAPGTVRGDPPSPHSSLPLGSQSFLVLFSPCSRAARFSYTVHICVLQTRRHKAGAPPRRARR